MKSEHILVGSRALAHWTDFDANESDWDIICPDEDLHMYDGKEGFDACGYSQLNNIDLCVEEYGKKSRVEILGREVLVCDLVSLSLLKRSHLWRDINWNRHMWMYQTHLAKHEKYWTYSDSIFLDNRIRLTMEKYPQGNPKLNQTNEGFFDDAVDKKFDHDWLHELVAFTGQPMYTKLKDDNKKFLAWCERDLWEKLSYMEKLTCVAEEAHVISCERFMIPNDWRFSPLRAYKMSLKKVCTTLCSGWFRDFAIDNYMRVLNMYSPITFSNVRKETT